MVAVCFFSHLFLLLIWTYFINNFYHVIVRKKYQELIHNILSSYFNWPIEMLLVLLTCVLCFILELFFIFFILLMFYIHFILTVSKKNFKNQDQPAYFARFGSSREFSYASMEYRDCIIR